MLKGAARPRKTRRPDGDVAERARHNNRNGRHRAADYRARLTRPWSRSRRVFVGHVGLAPYANDILSAGEQNKILAAGHMNVAAVFGVHRFHHVDGDDVRCVDAGAVTATAAAFQLLVEGVVG